MFGSASVFDGSNGERFLKWIVKDLVRNTQKVPAKLVEQLSLCKYDLDVIEHVFKYGVKMYWIGIMTSSRVVERINFRGNIP